MNILGPGGGPWTLLKVRNSPGENFSKYLLMNATDCLLASEFARQVMSRTVSHVL